MRRLNTTFVLGYHGCDAGVAERLLGGEAFRSSANDYDWLGHGIYFWEANPDRALTFAEEAARRRRKAGEVFEPAMVGAVIDLGLCLDLTTSLGIAEVAAAYPILQRAIQVAGGKMPGNTSNELRRPLDCAVINTVHDMRAERAQAPIDTVRGVFVEGAPAYPGGGIRTKTHIQIAVRNAQAIKGVFRVRP